MSRTSATQRAGDMMPTGLVRRGGRYSLRRRIPQDLIGHYGKREVTSALGTSDPKEARKLLPVRWLELDREFDAVRANLAVKFNERPLPVSELSPTLISIVNLDRLREERDRAAAAGKLKGFVSQARDTLRLIQAMLDGERRPEESLLVLEGKRNALKAVLDGENAFAISAARKTRQAITEEQNLLKFRISTTWDELIDKWAFERKKDAKSKGAHAAVARWFSERVGCKPIEMITKRDVLDFKDKLIAEGVSASNINVKLTRLRTLLNYAFDNDLVAIQAASGIRVHDAEASTNRRRPFDLEALEKLFSGPVHACGERPSGGRGEAAYWLPLLALYTGARLEELGQLRPRDVRQERLNRYEGQGSVWVIAITSDEVDGLKLKNSGSDRVVPVHQELIRLGFIDFCGLGQSDGRVKLFPQLKPNVHGVLTAKWGEWFSGYLRKTCGVTDKRIVFHSLRHTFKDFARNSGLPEGMQRQLMGHAGRDVADGYGAGYSVEMLSKGINKYKVSGFYYPLVRSSG